MFSNPQPQSVPQVWVATKVMYQAKTNKCNSLPIRIIETDNNSTLKAAAITNSSPNQCYKLLLVIKANRKYSKCVQNQLAVNRTMQQQQHHRNWFTVVSLKSLNLKLLIRLLRIRLMPCTLMWLMSLTTPITKLLHHKITSIRCKITWIHKVWILVLREKKIL